MSHTDGGETSSRTPLNIRQRSSSSVNKFIHNTGCEILNQFIKIFNFFFCSPDTRRNGLAVILDAQRSAWRMARACIRQVGVTLGADAAAIIVLRPEAFWDKQRVDNCARTQKEGEVSVLSQEAMHI